MMSSKVWTNLQFNTLVFLTNRPSVNTRRTGAALQQSYVRQALALARSLDSLGKTLRVFTNDRTSFLDIASSESQSEPLYTVQEVCFPSDIPATIRFFAAHHKLFLFSVFAREARYNCLLDTDVVANHAKRSLIKLLEENVRVDGWVYDISDQVFPALGTTTVQDDLRELGVQHPFPRWYGGEFIIGNARLFSYLHAECLRQLEKYIEASARLHQVSDESLVSAALNNNYQNLTLADAGASGLVVRHWACKTRHVKRPPSVLHESLFWHLPNSKDALALYRKHGSLRILYRHIQGLTVAMNAVGRVREALRR
ncbi:MAG TPA: hypothetical protein VGI46_21290 [Candidatus Acidoferrum sp.]